MTCTLVSLDCITTAKYTTATTTTTEYLKHVPTESVIFQARSPKFSTKILTKQEHKSDDLRNPPS